MFGNKREDFRQSFADAWHKHGEGLPLEPLEQVIVSVIEQHPEYHATVEDKASLHSDFSPESGQTNPFLHMAMHIALIEQITTDRPPGIREAYANLERSQPDPHRVQHKVLECLGECMYEAQVNNAPPDEARYLRMVRALAGR